MIFLQVDIYCLFKLKHLIFSNKNILTSMLFTIIFDQIKKEL